MRLKSLLTSKYFSPTAVTFVLGAAAIYATYHRFRISCAFFVLMVAQGAVGIWRRRKRKNGVGLAAFRITAAIAVLAPFMYRDSYGVIWSHRIRFTLLGDVPTDISQLKTYEDIWTDYVITMRFHANPESVSRILNSGKFKQATRADTRQGMVFEPVNKRKDVLHRISVSKDYSEVFIEYAED